MAAVVVSEVASPTPALAAPKDAARSAPVAKFVFAEKAVERAGRGSGSKWERVSEGDQLRIGDRLRTGPLSLSRLEFPWMVATLSPDSVLVVPVEVVLALSLESGRIDLRTDGAEIVKLRTAEAAVRGEGRVIIRRESGATFVTALEGAFEVEGKTGRERLVGGEGTVVKAGQKPSPPEALPQPPGELAPGSDPRYVAPGDPVLLTWRPQTKAHLQILGIDSEDALIDRDVGPPPQAVEIPWVGTFRWRVSTRDDRGLEGVPSGEGVICVVAKIGK